MNDQNAFNQGITLADLAQLGDKAAMILTRDLNDLARFGVTTQTIQDITDLTAQLKAMPTDEESIVPMKQATARKNELRDEATSMISDIMLRVKSVFSQDSIEYTSFKTKFMHNETDAEFSQTASRMVRQANAYLPDLQAKGLTQPEIDALKAKAVLFDAAIEAQLTGETDRHLATRQRNQIAGNLYALIAEAFDAGKQWYEKRDEIRYAEYVIHEGAGPVAGAEE